MMHDDPQTVDFHQVCAQKKLADSLSDVLLSPSLALFTRCVVGRVRSSLDLPVARPRR